MRFIGYEILQHIVEKREISYREASKLLPCQFNDHRDFYPLASLYTAGFISCTLCADSPTKHSDQNLFMASFFYATTRGPGTHKCNMFTALNTENTDLENKIFATAKADILFADWRQKRIERLYTILISILVGATSSILTLVVKSWFSS